MPMKLRISVSFSAGFHRNTRGGKSCGHVLLTRKILIIRQSCYLVPRFVVPCSLFRKAVHFLGTYFPCHFAFLHRLITFVRWFNKRKSIYMNDEYVNEEATIDRNETALLDESN